jgi:hypothetical protein
MKILKILSIIYLVIIGSYYLSIIYDGLSSDISSAPIFWFRWVINFLSLLAVAVVIFRSVPVHIIFWRATLILLLSMESYSLFRFGLFLHDADLVTNLLILTKYLILVGPPVVSLVYLSFKARFNGTG